MKQTIYRGKGPCSGVFISRGMLNTLMHSLVASGEIDDYQAIRKQVDSGRGLYGRHMLVIESDNNDILMGVTDEEYYSEEARDTLGEVTDYPSSMVRMGTLDPRNKKELSVTAEASLKHVPERLRPAVREHLLRGRVSSELTLEQNMERVQSTSRVYDEKVVDLGALSDPTHRQYTFAELTKKSVDSRGDL